MSDNALLKLGEDVVARLGQGPGAQDLIEQRRRFLTDAQRKKSAFRFPALVIAGATAAAGVIAVVLSVVRIEGISYRVGEDQNFGVEGQWVEADDAGPVPIHFEGGSEFVLDAKSAARVVRLSSEEVIIDLSKGTVRCKVRGDGKTGWIVRAGGYRVEVTGTKFDVVWDPGSVELDVTVTHGSVLVSGKALSEHGVKLQAGDHLSVNRDHTTLYQDAPPAGQQVPHVETDSQDHVSVDPLRSESAVLQPSEEVRQSPRVREAAIERTEWKQLYGKKEYEEVIEQITAQGLEPFIQDASEQELWQVGKAARYARRGEVAHRVLQALINRFPNRPRSLEGTFLLGRVEMELRGDPIAAQKWFEQYLSQAPNGPLAEESLGRLIDICRLIGKDSAAQKYARRYLPFYPRGPFAPLAQSVLSTDP